MKQFVITLTVILLAGCATGPFSQKSDLEAASQQQGTVVSCNGYKTWQDCDRTAAKTCPNGFEVLAKEENLPTQNRTLRISCK